MSQLLSALPVGSLVKDVNTKYNTHPIIWTILEHGHSGDPSGSTTLQVEKIITLKTFDAKEPNSNVEYRKGAGNNRYRYSNILQWLNSSSSNWYVKKHTYDTPPDSTYGGVNPYKSEAGFLTNFSSDFRSSLMDVKKRVCLPNVDGSGHEDVTSKLFLLSMTEVSGRVERNQSTGDEPEGSRYSYFNDHEVVKAIANQEALGNVTNVQVGQNYGWFLRTPENQSDGSYTAPYLASMVRSLAWYGYDDANEFPTYLSRSDMGIVPACCVSSNLLVSDSPDSDGAYTFVFNAAPTISPASTNYGNVATPPAITCTIADADGDSFTYTVKLNGVTMTSGSATASKTFALDMTSYWSQMALGTNTIVVQATDSQGATASATYTMNKTNSAAPVPTTDLVNNARKDISFYIGFQIGQDSDGDSQTVVAQVADNSSMTNPTEFTSVEKLVAGAWIPVQTLTNADAGASLRIQVTGQTVGDTIYVRLKDTDSGSGSPVYTSTYAVSIGSTLEFDTLPISRTTKPSIVVAYLDKTMPADATLQMYACNNANDATPTWEPITEGESHQFTNKTKTATNWGVSVKTNIAAGATAGEISVSAVGLGVL